MKRSVNASEASLSAFVEMVEVSPEQKQQKQKTQKVKRAVTIMLDSKDLGFYKRLFSVSDSSVA